MPAKDHYHDTVIRALVKVGWTITDQQFMVRARKRRLWIDIRAAKPDENIVILVEVKGLENYPSPIEELANVVGKYLLYRTALDSIEDNTPLYLAASTIAYEGILNEPIAQQLILRTSIRLMIFDPVKEEIVRWIP